MLSPYYRGTSATSYHSGGLDQMICDSRCSLNDPVANFIYTMKVETGIAWGAADGIGLPASRLRDRC